LIAKRAMDELKSMLCDEQKSFTVLRDNFNFSTLEEIVDFFSDLDDYGGLYGPGLIRRTIEQVCGKGNLPFHNMDGLDEMAWETGHLQLMGLATVSNKPSPTLIMKPGMIGRKGTQPYIACRMIEREPQAFCRNLRPEAIAWEDGEGNYYLTSFIATLAVHFPGYFEDLRNQWGRVPAPTRKLLEKFRAQLNENYDVGFHLKI
jgi:hypothetical protein